MFKGVKKAIISVYAPTNVSSQMIQDEFYDELARAHVDGARKYSEVCICGDFNARIGHRDDQTWNKCCGSQLQQEDAVDGNGLRLLQFCQQQEMIIGNTCFSKSNKGTWKHPRRSCWVTLDYCLYSKVCSKLG